MTDTQTARPAGHPAHQQRPFRVTARLRARRAQTEIVVAQTERDAILRAGVALAARHPGTDPGEWRVTDVTDPAPRTYCPDEPAPDLPAAGMIRFEAFDIATGQRWTYNEWDQADRPKLTAYVTRTTSRGRSRVTLTWPDGTTKNYPKDK